MAEKKRPFDYAISQAGLNEKQNAGALKDYLQTGGVNLDPRQLAWCAAFVNSSLDQAGLPGTGSPAARSFENYGTPVQPEAAQQGDLVVQSRKDPKNPNAGHVGFFAGPSTRGDTWMLGGNQGRKGEVSLQPFTEQRLLGYRRPPDPSRDALAQQMAQAQGGKRL